MRVHLHADDFWAFVTHGAIAPYKIEAHDQNRVVTGALAVAAGAYVTGGCHVVVDGVIGPWFLAPFTALGVPLDYVVLQPPLSLAQTRCAARTDQLVALETVAALHRQFADLGDDAHHALPVHDETPAALLAAIEEILAAGTHRMRRA